MASERISLPGSSNVVAVSYKGTAPDLRRAQLVREKQSRDTTDRMECGRLIDLDASAWADAQRSKDRGHHGQVGRQGAANSREHTFIGEVRQAAQKQKENKVLDWLEEPEPEPEEVKHSGGNARRHHVNTVGAASNSSRGHRGQLGRRKSRGNRYQHAGQRGRVSQRDRLPANSFHRLLPEEWGQGKHQRAINWYKRDLRQAEEELQQLNFRAQPEEVADSDG